MTVVPNFNDVELGDFMSEEDYDKKKAGIVSRAVEGEVKVQYQKGINCAFESKKGYIVVKAKPKQKGIDGNTAINHELAHVLFKSFDKRAQKTIKLWSEKWNNLGVQTTPQDTKDYANIQQSAWKTYHEAMNVIEDQRIESLWGKLYLGNVKDFKRVRKALGKELKFVDHPSAVLLAERFLRKDLVDQSKYAHLAPFIYKVEGKELKATMIILNQIKPYLDEVIKEQWDKKMARNILRNKYKELSESISKDRRQGKQSYSDDKDLKKLSDDMQDLNNEITDREQLSDKRPNPYQTRQEDPLLQKEIDGAIPYELDDGDVDAALTEEEDKAKDTIQGIRDKMSGVEVTPTNNIYVRDKQIDKTETPSKPNINMKTVKEFQKMMRTFKEKSREEISSDGYDLDIGEYINMKANGYGDCFIEEQEDNGLSVVISIDGSGSMREHNKIVKEMVSTLWESTRLEKNIEIKCIVWSSDRLGNMAIQRYRTQDELNYLDSQRGGYTPTPFGIQAGAEELSRMSGRRKLLIVITDGFPNYYRNGQKIRQNVTSKETIKEYKKALKYIPNISIVGVGRYCSGYYYRTNTMQHMFGKKNYVACRTMQEVDKFMTEKLKKEIVRVMKRR
jgi:hypothetical protein